MPIYLRLVRKICSSLIEEDVLSRVTILTRRWRFHLNISCWPYWWLLRIFGGFVTLVAAVGSASARRCRSIHLRPVPYERDENTDEHLPPRTRVEVPKKQGLNSKALWQRFLTKQPLLFEKGFTGRDTYELSKNLWKHAKLASEGKIRLRLQRLPYSLYLLMVLST